MLVLAGGQLRALGKHRQAAAAQRAPAAGSWAGEGEKQRREGDAQTGVTEQTAQIKMENQVEAAPPGSPGQEWRLDGAEGGVPFALARGPQLPRSPEPQGEPCRG